MLKMRTLFMSLIYSAFIICATSGDQLLQSESQTTAPGTPVQLTCNILSHTGYWINWIRQAPGKGLEWVGQIHPDEKTINYGATFTGRCVISRVNSQSMVYLLINSPKTEDTAVYYCARDGARYFDYWGPGTSVTVTAAASQAPSLYPLISYGASMDPVAVGCLAKDFLPEPVTFSWTDKNNSSFTGGLRTYPSVLGSGGTYTASSGVLVPLNSWNNRDAYYCKLTHSALGQPLVKKLIQQVQKINTPIVTIHPPIKEDIDNRNATIVCMCRDFYPEAITVTWLKNGEKVTTNVRTEGPVANSNGDFDITSRLDIASADWNRNYLYSCMVDHAASKYLNSKNISKSLLCEATSSGPATFDVFTVTPTFEEIFQVKSAKLICAVTNMLKSESLNITWTRLDTKEVLKTEITDIVLNDNGTFSAMGIATVCTEDWTGGHKFECKVLHDELASQKLAYLQKKNGMPASKPVVYVYPPTSEELALKEYVNIICVVKRYNPCDVLVKWLKEKDEVQKGNYVNTKHIEEVDPTTGQKTCLLYSSLKVTEIEWNSGTVYTCVVGHEALPMQLTQKSIDKSSVKALYIDEEEDLENIWRTTSTFIILFLLSLFYSATVTLFKVK